MLYTHALSSATNSEGLGKVVSIEFNELFGRTPGYYLRYGTDEYYKENGATSLERFITSIRVVGLEVGGRKAYSPRQNHAELPWLWLHVNQPELLFTTLGEIDRWITEYNISCFRGLQSPIEWFGNQEKELPFVYNIFHKMCHSDFVDPETYFAGWLYGIKHNSFENYTGACDFGDNVPFSACRIIARPTELAAYETPYTFSLEYQDGQEITPGHNVRYIQTSENSATVYAIQAPSINGWTEGNLRRVLDELPAEAVEAYSYMVSCKQDRGLQLDDLALFLLHDDLKYYELNPTPLATLAAIKTLRRFANWHLVEENTVLVADTLSQFDIVRQGRRKLNKCCKVRNASPSSVASLTAVIGLFASRGITSVSVPLVFPLLLHTENEGGFDTHRALSTYSTVENMVRLVNGITAAPSEQGDVLVLEIDPQHLSSDNIFLSQLLNMHEVIDRLDQ